MSLNYKCTEVALKFLKLNPQTQQREAVVQGRSLSPYRLRYTASYAVGVKPCGCPYTKNEKDLVGL
ncbi:MAG: hypothetical protein LBJ00_04705 [Planctomycetaceae bacterium]|nr:hypothetical protein [Planctomycetaceae bacterium]